MPQRERQQTVLELLGKLHGLDPLKELFWSELNYERVNQPLSRREWSDTAAKALAEDPVLFAGGGANNEFHIIYARLTSKQLLLGQERPVVSRLLRDHPYALFVFSNAAQNRWHFLNVKDDEKREKRHLFRRITVGPEERLRTASERLAMLDLESIQPDLFGLAPLAIQQRCDEAFDVEAVTKQFFKTFAELFHAVASDIAQVRGLEKDAGKLAQLLLDRMLFLYFIQKKGWLEGDPDYLYMRFQECWKKDPHGHSYYSSVLYPLFLCLSDMDAEVGSVGAVPFLNGGLFEESAKQTQAERLEQARLRIKNTTFKAIFDDLLERFNFTVTEDTPLDVEVAIDPEMLGKIFESLILQLEKDPDKDLRKLTGSYYTPRPIVHFMCQEALKEYLVTQLAGDNAAKAEMVQEKVSALLALPPADQLDEEQGSTLKELFTPPEAKTLRQAILDCRICDPAVGSGAFPVGMLHEMTAAVARLDLYLHGPDVLKRRNYDYDLKKQVIEWCLYGVDIQEQAVRLCELRLWLSLVVDYQIDLNKPFAKAIREVPSLPNLSYHIVRGDSLLERLFGHVVQLDEMARDPKTQQLVGSIQADKMSYFREGNTAEKRRLELKILAKQADLAERLVETKRQLLVQHNLSLFEESAKDKKLRETRDAQEQPLEDLKNKIHTAKVALERLASEKHPIARGDLNTLRRQHFHTGDAPTFMWRVDFAEVFGGRGGFDIVIANPPYLRMEIIKAIAPDLKKQYRCATGRADGFIYFFEQGVQLLSQGGTLIYISSSTYAKTASGQLLRNYLREHTTIRRYVDFGDLQVFEGVTTYPAVILLQKAKPSSEHQVRATEIKSLNHAELLEEFTAPGILVPQAELGHDGWHFEDRHLARLRAKIHAAGVPLKEYCGSPLYGIKTGLNEAFVIDTETHDALVAEDKRSAEILKPFLEGKDLKPWRAEWRGLWLIYTHHGIDIRKYPAILNHLKQFKAALERRATIDHHKWYELQQPQFTYTRQYSEPKIILCRFMNTPTFAYDDEGTFWINNALSVIPRGDYYILAILQSTPGWFALKANSTAMQNGYWQAHIHSVEPIPIPLASAPDKQVIISLAKRLSAERCPDRQFLEAELDDRVATLYGLTSEERRAAHCRLSGNEGTSPGLTIKNLQGRRA